MIGLSDVNPDHIVPVDDRIKRIYEKYIVGKKFLKNRTRMYYFMPNLWKEMKVYHCK